MRKAKCYKIAACFRKNDVPNNLYISRQVTLPVWIFHLPKSSVIFNFVMWNTLLIKFHISFVWFCHVVCHDPSPTRQENRTILFVFCCSRITSINNPIFCMPVVSVSHKDYGHPTSLTWPQLLSADQYWHLERADYKITRTRTRNLPAVT